MLAYTRSQMTVSAPLPTGAPRGNHEILGAGSRDARVHIIQIPPKRPMIRIVGLIGRVKSPKAGYLGVDDYP